MAYQNTTQYTPANTGYQYNPNVGYQYNPMDPNQNWGSMSNIVPSSTPNTPSMASTMIAPQVNPGQVGQGSYIWEGNNTSTNNTSPAAGWGMNPTTLGVGANLLQGVGQLAQGWAALKQIGIAKNQLAEGQRQYNQNYDAQKVTTNNAIADQNAYKIAQGRNDLAKYVL